MVPPNTPTLPYISPQRLRAYNLFGVDRPDIQIAGIGGRRSSPDFHEDVHEAGARLRITLPGDEIEDVNERGFHERQRVHEVPVERNLGHAKLRSDSLGPEQLVAVRIGRADHGAVLRSEE